MAKISIEDDITLYGLKYEILNYYVTEHIDSIGGRFDHFEGQVESYMLEKAEEIEVIEEKDGERIQQDKNNPELSLGQASIILAYAVRPAYFKED